MLYFILYTLYLVKWSSLVFQSAQWGLLPRTTVKSFLPSTEIQFTALYHFSFIRTFNIRYYSKPTLISDNIFSFWYRIDVSVVGPGPALVRAALVTAGVSCYYQCQAAADRGERRVCLLSLADICHQTPWRNGSASDSRSEGCVFESRRGQRFLPFQCPIQYLVFLVSPAK